MNKTQTIIVKTASGSYPVYFSGIKKGLGKIIRSGSRVVIISNPTVFALHGDKLIKDILPRRIKPISLIIGDGERYKNQKTVNQIYDHLFDIGVGRGDYIVAFGGGVVGDTAGFAAATYMRGMRLIHIPTTLLSMVDSSIGGKVGINHSRGKNLIGAFYQPQAVAVNLSWLKTLGRRELVEGLGEVVKVGFLSSMGFLNSAVSVRNEELQLSDKMPVELIRKSIAFKANIVASDTHDRGIRAILNFGHTFGHAIEKTEGFRRYHHGEAVLAGMAGALYLSHSCRLLSNARLKKYLSLLSPFMARLLPLKKEPGDYLSPMSVDKKNINGSLNFVLLEKVGHPVVRIVKSEKKVLDAIVFMKDFVNSRGRL